MITIFGIDIEVLERISEELESDNWYVDCKIDDGDLRVVTLAPSVIFKFRCGDITIDYRGRLATMNSTNFNRIEIV